MTPPAPGDLTRLGLLGISGNGPDPDPSSLHTILCAGGWEQLHGHSWSFCRVGKGWFGFLKFFQVLVGTKSPICGWIQDCTASGNPKTSKAWGISGYVWLVLGGTVGQQWEPAELSTRNSLGMNSCPSSSTPFLCPILWVSPSSLCQSRCLGLGHGTRAGNSLEFGQNWERMAFLFIPVSWET